MFLILPISKLIFLYDLFKQDDTTYVFLEKYKDEASFDLHKKTDYYKSIGAQLGAYMASAPDIKVLQAV